MHPPWYHKTNGDVFFTHREKVTESDDATEAGEVILSGTEQKRGKNLPGFREKFQALRVEVRLFLPSKPFRELGCARDQQQEKTNRRKYNGNWG
jgi:hypothetical protein